MLKIFLVKFILKKLTGAKENQNQLFQRTRCQLAAWYAGIIGVILGLCGLGVYEAIIYAQRLTIDQKLESYANELHEILEPVLKDPGELEAQASAILPHFCIVETGCQGLKVQGTPLADTGENGTYYIRLLDLSGKLIAIIGQEPRGLQTAFKKEEMWQDLRDIQGDRYRQISVILHNHNFENWGYLQVARTLKDLDRYRSNLELMLLMGLPAAIFILAIASWWLAGKAMAPIYQSYRQIQQFTADAAHELRTPLAAIRATVESVLMMPKLEETEARETLQVVKRQNLRLSNLVADLLMLCRIDAQLTAFGQASQFQECICINDLIKELAEDFAALALASHIQFSIKIFTSEPLKIIGNYEQLYRLVSNIVVNALQYTPTGGRVTLILKRSNHYAFIGVKDTGIGISPEEQVKIFDRFYRVNPSRQIGGSGLGLSIAAAIAQAHRGKIEVESQLGKGSKFTIWLPMSRDLK